MSCTYSQILNQISDLPLSTKHLIMCVCDEFHDAMDMDYESNLPLVLMDIAWKNSVRCRKEDEERWEKNEN